jgi:hypothetical protein
MLYTHMPAGEICPRGSHKTVEPSGSFSHGGTDYVLMWSLRVEKELQDHISRRVAPKAQLLAQLGMN